MTHVTVRRLAVPLVLVALALACLGAPPDLAAAQQGTVTGLVVDRGTGRPLAGVQVFIEGAGLGGLSTAAGRYLLTNVPPGQATITAELIGYATVRETVTVPAGASAVVNFELQQTALQLDELIITGTAGGTQRRAIGNVVDRVDVASRAEISPVATLQEMLSRQTPGVSTPGLNGLVGAGTAMRIRGVSSIQLGSNPILYVDGIRVDNNPETGPNIRAGRQAARMNDFNPDDIESIEIIKGPAAATLYGTEASNGVIQIITKRGAAGSPTLDLSVRQGLNYMDSPAERFFETYWLDPATGQLRDVMNVYTRWEEDRTINPSGEPLFTYGHIQDYDLAVRGGTDLLRYYVSGGYGDETGIVDYNWKKQMTTRANVSVTPSERWDLDTSLGFVRSHTRFAQASTGQGIWEAIVWTHPDQCQGPTRCFRYLPPEAAAEVDSRQKVGRFTGSLQITHHPASWLTHRLKAGVDYVADLSTKLFPRVRPGEFNFFGGQGSGEKTVENTNTQFTTADYAASGTFDVTPALRSTTSVGVQYYQRQTEASFAVGNQFPIPEITTVSGAAVRTGGESWEENKQLGTYLQQELGWNGRLFVTGAIRADANSAFGADFDAAYYPKLSATWVVTDEPFWNVSWLNQLRLRTAWGQAGMQPGAFDAVTLYTPVTGPGGQGVLTPQSKGDPGLKPEVGTELEVGFDASLWQDRVGIEFTYYTRTTKDALLPQLVRPSSGFIGSQLVNLGETANWGTELAVTTDVLDRENLGISLGVNFATTRNEIKDLGGNPIPGGHGTRNVPGFPINGFFARIPLSGELVPGTRTTRNMTCDGGQAPFVDNGSGSVFARMGGDPVPCAQAPFVLFQNRGPEPLWNGSQITTLRLGRDLRVSSVIEFAGGHLGNSMIAGAHRSMNSTPAVNPLTDPRLAYYLTAGNNAIPGTFKAGWARWRELSATYNLPAGLLSRGGASRASLTVGWRNIGFLWIEEPFVWGSRVFDPEQTGAGDDRTISQVTEIAPTSRILMTLRVSF